MSQAMGDTDLTKGWDVVFAVRYPALNIAIRNAYTSTPQSMPGEFQGSVHGKLGSSSVKGIWGMWQITTGGSGTYIQMECPILKGWYKENQLDLAGYKVLIRVQLWFFDHKSDHPSAAAGSDGTLRKALKLLVDKSDPTNPPVVIVSIMDSDNQPLGPGDTGMLAGPLQNWFMDNLVLFDHVFCTADVTQAEADAPGLYWLKPSYVAYAAAEPFDTSQLTHEQRMDQSVFAILHTIESRDPAGLSPAVDLNAIPFGRSAAFSLSRKRFLRHFIEPALPFLFQIDTSQCTDQASVEKLLKEFGGHFEIDNDDKEITNKRNLNLPPMRLPEELKNKIVYPDIAAGDFSLELDGQVLRLTFKDMHFEFSPGINVYITYTSELTMSMKNRHLHLTETKRSQRSTITKEAWVTWAEVIGGIVLAVALVPLGGAAGKAIGGVVSRTTATAAQEAAEGASTIAAETAEVAVTEIANVASEETALLEREAATAAAEETSAIVTRASRVVRSVKGYFQTSKAKLAGQMVAASTAATIASTPEIMQAVAEDALESKVPDLSKFSEEVLFNIAWADASRFDPDQAELHDALQISGEITVEHT
jgi:hypothetical protein